MTQLNKGEKRPGVHDMQETTKGIVPAARQTVPKKELKKELAINTRRYNSRRDR